MLHVRVVSPAEVTERLIAGLRLNIRQLSQLQRQGNGTLLTARAIGGQVDIPGIEGEVVAMRAEHVRALGNLTPPQFHQPRQWLAFRLPNLQERPFPVSKVLRCA